MWPPARACNRGCIQRQQTTPSLRGLLTNNINPGPRRASGRQALGRGSPTVGAGWRFRLNLDLLAPALVLLHARPLRVQ